MINKYFLTYLIAFLVLSSGSAVSQSRKIIIKLKSSSPENVISAFKTGNSKAGNTSLAKLCRDFNVANTKQVFEKLLNTVKKEELEYFGLDRIFIAEIGEQNREQALRLFMNNEFVEYIQENNKYSLNVFTPNDPLYSGQYYLNKIYAQNVWDITQGDSTVIIGVIDSGLDFLHPDLKGSYKINYGEIPGNGIDDDNNGYVDDYLGWNFSGNNNNPADDNIFSHGTAVTGVLTAGFNNGIGMASIAPACKVLVMKTFDAQGFGYDNDVASAVLYAVSRGVKVINMSFGDYVYSSLLRDVIRFAYSKNIVLVSSAGNDNSDVLHYPSAFDEVISVGASDINDNKASFSAYGETVDLFAPGYQILSASRLGKGSSEFNNDYAYINGTSFSAPLVSGISALLLSKNKNLTNEEIRGILVSTTDYFPGQGSWNHLHSSGRLNALNAVNNFNSPSVVRIFHPYQDLSDTLNTLPVVISAASPLFQSYSVYYAIGENPVSFIPVVSNNTNQVLNDTACILNLTSLPDTSLTLRLAINSNTGRTIEHRLIFYHDRRESAVTEFAAGEILEKDYSAELITFATKYKSLGKIYFKRKNIPEPYNYIFADGSSGNIGLISEFHYGLIRHKDLIQNAEYEYYIESRALNGKISIMQDTSFHFTVKPRINNYGFVTKGYRLPFVQTCNSIYDVSNSGNKDLFANEIDSNLKLKVFRFASGTFSQLQNYSLPDFSVARDLTYLTPGSNKINLLTSTSRNGAVYEALFPNQYPVLKVWSDEGNDNFWSSRFGDVNGNGNKEIIGFGKSGLRFIEFNGSSFNEIANLPYSHPTAQANSQNVLIEDFDSDGKNEIAFVDTYFPNAGTSSQFTGVNVYKNSGGNNFSRVFIDSVQMFIKGDNIISGDFDGDGKKEFAIGTTSNSSDLVQYYSLYIYKYVSGQYRIIDILNIYNTDANAEVSTKAGNIDSDIKDEILVNTGKCFYVFKFNSSLQKSESVFFRENINSVNQLVYDFDGNGIQEIGLNNINDTMYFYEKDIPFSGPPTSLSFAAYSIDSGNVYLNYSSVPGADYYRIYRADNDTLNNFILYDSSASVVFNDYNVLNRKNYLYRITAVDTNLPVQESKPTNPVKVYVHNKSKLTKTVSDGNGFVTVTFSEKVNIVNPVPASFSVSQLGTPKLAVFRNQYEYLLTFENRIPNGTYTLKTSGLYDFYGSPVDTNSKSFTVNHFDSIQFYIKNVSLTDKYRLRVEFNLNTDTLTSRNPGNYSFEPFGFKVLSVEPDAIKNVIYLNLSTGGYIGASGKNYLLKASNIYSSTGVKITDGAGGSFGLIFNKENLSDVFVYPNPHTKNSKGDYITFANLTRTAKIYIYDLTGRYIAVVEAVNGNGGAEWNLKTTDGKDAPTGIYIFRAEGKDSNGNSVEEKTGKFMIIR
ncbi:MAG: S8 family serine peptidase [Ignavibacteriae bacterium]|nr:S8 family serine peptidase [Ignavibacteriota bacterium]